MPRYPAQELVAESFRHEWSRDRPVRGSKELLRGRSIILSPFGFGIEANHSGFINRIGQVIQGMSGLWRQLFAIEEYGFVLRKEMQVINQSNEPVIADFRIGRVSIFDIDLSFRQCGITESVIDPENLRGGELITLAHRSPAIAALKKFMGQPELQLTMCT